MPGPDPAQPYDASIRVVVADDSGAFLEVVQSLLARDPSIEVVGVARDGPHAVELALQLRPDVLVLDHHMPGLTGIQAAATIEILRRDIRVVIMSADESGRAERESEASSVRRFVPKRDIGATLLEAIQEAVRASPSC